MARISKMGWGKKQAAPRPDGQVRQSQVVTTFGPGSMMDLVDHAVLVSGLDFWSYDSRRVLGGAVVIQDARLRDALIRKGIKDLDPDAAFKEPPASDDSQPSPTCGIQALEFPTWFVCQNPNCRALVRSNGLEMKGGRYIHRCDRERVSECVPVRFVQACRRGHIEDFRWMEFAHTGGARCASPQLRLLETETGDFGEIVVACACGKRQKLITATVPEARPTCGGHRPWLGPEAKEDCSEQLRLLVRTASNSYFPQVVSALSIPDPGRRLHDAVRLHWDILKAASAETLPAFRTIEKVRVSLAGYDDASVLAVVGELRGGGERTWEPLRTAEFKTFLEQEYEKPGDLPGQDERFYARRVVPEGGLPDGAKVARVVLAKKLREVRVQVGFTRIEPPTADLQGEYDLRVAPADVRLTESWLPASEMRGEGVFVQLDEAAVREWEERPAVVARDRELAEGYKTWAASIENPPPFPGARFYMLHSLSHLLVSAISLECGYAASAIRERLYSSLPSDAVPMAAVLLTTGTSGTEGTLGGLVEQGRRIGAHLRRAWDLGVLCSNDPVCASHSPRADQEERHLEGAACHGCLFIAECSCERFNRHLDRALVVPTIGHDPTLAFFTERP